MDHPPSVEGIREWLDGFLHGLNETLMFQGFAVRACFWFCVCIAFYSIKESLRFKESCFIALSCHEVRGLAG